MDFAVAQNRIQHKAVIRRPVQADHGVPVAGVVVLHPVVVARKHDPFGVAMITAQVADHPPVAAAIHKAAATLGQVSPAQHLAPLQSLMVIGVIVLIIATAPQQMHRLMQIANLFVELLE
tara:strand:+ start:491 stop:850 length:360 start_codon:yes stop_codon:yes gene_type:complete